jgi:DNA-binding response OmpR family regulator
VEQDGPFAAVVLDLSMPGMSGAETLAELRRIDPSVPVLLASGYSESRSALGASEGVAFLAKPFEPRALVDALQALLSCGLRPQPAPEAPPKAGA